MDMNELMAQQRAFFNSNQTKPVGFRVEQLRRLQHVLKTHEPELFEAIYEDFGKSRFDTYASELSFIHHEINLMLRNLRRWSKLRRVSGGLANFPARAYILPEPLGTTLVIGAWNYPYQLSFVPAISALAAGNTVVLKPSELPSKTSALMARLVNSHFDRGFFHVVEGGVEETSALLDQRFDKIFFTGSIPVGRLVHQAAAKHLTPVTLELGGKSPAFVFADCDVAMTARRLAWAKFFNAGQTCVAPDFLLVEKSVEDRLLRALYQELEAYDISGSELPEHYVRIINEKHFDRLCGLMDRSKVSFGGEVDRDARLIGPTVMRQVSFNDPIMVDEIFGPILPVLTFTDLDDAIRRVKERPKPLACYVFSKSKDHVSKILSELSFGGGCVNDAVMHLSNSDLPFGGVGMSGMGQYHGKAGFDAFTHYKSILHKPFWFEPGIKYPPYSSWKLSLIRRIVG